MTITPSDSRQTTVVIHGSALHRPDTAQDVDALYIGDITTAMDAVRGWAARRGLSHLPVDMHGEERIANARQQTLVVPRVYGCEAPHEVLLHHASDCIEVRKHDRISSHLRRPVSAAEIHDGIMGHWRGAGRLRVNLAEDRWPERPDWTSYADVDGRHALASGVRHARRNGAWEGLLSIDRAMYSTLAAIGEFGAERFVARVDPAIVAAVRGGGCTRGFPLDVCTGDVYGMPGSVTRPVILSTHAGAYTPRVCWRGWESLQRSVVEGTPPETF